ncbi:hypothetical protein J7337_010350 [Fusarium musae]|uniref:Uncharacterized protein n=1 Tax=Fusarium musae TaxID=1042133 RepID=A0A9P8D8V5_9HYPO|nr:hypothetical protein J7337_010350 [Fusarium musae]KAG9497489.1 hypothetical protein J7337_010350 [Fusarium musae]
MLGSFLSSCPDAADEFQGDMDRRFQKSPEYQSPVMQRAIFTLKENFVKVTKNMSALLANNLARFILYEMSDLRSSTVAHISLCSVYKSVSSESRGTNRINYPSWFFLACLSSSWGVKFPADQVIYPTNKSVEEQEILFIAESVPATNDESRVKAEIKSETKNNSSNELAHALSTEAPALTRTPKGSNMEKRLADIEKQLLSMRKEQKRKFESLEAKLDSIYEMNKSRKAEKEKTELDSEEAETDLASYEMVAHDVKASDGAVKHEVIELE